jgi:hypothetical protein
MAQQGAHAHIFSYMFGSRAKFDLGFREAFA